MTKAAGAGLLIAGVVIGVVMANSHVVRLRPQAGYAGQQQEEPASKSATEFSLKDLDGNTVSFADFKDKTSLLLFFWTTWCPHCRAKIEPLNKIVEQFKDKNIKILAIDTGESREKILSFIESHPVSFAVLLDKDMSVAERYRVVGVPTFIVVAADGSVKFHDNILPDNIEQLLGL